MAPDKVRTSYTYVIMFLAFAVLAGMGFTYTNHVQRESDHQWCALLTSITQPLPVDPPPTERQLTTYTLLKDLARDKGCIP